jgi:hypothetical protein
MTPKEEIEQMIADRTEYHRTHLEKRILGQIWVNGRVVGNSYDPKAEPPSVPAKSE